MSTSEHYILTNDRIAIPCELMHWARWLETADRVVRQDFIHGVKISTVFLGLDHNWDEAEQMHQVALALVKEK